jgi:hypothetical protein
MGSGRTAREYLGHGHASRFKEQGISDAWKILPLFRVTVGSTSATSGRPGHGVVAPLRLLGDIGPVGGPDVPDQVPCVVPVTCGT